MSSMRAMRRLRPDSVPDELLRKVIEAATWAPTAGHLQHASFVLVTDRQQMAKVAATWQAVVAFYKETFLPATPIDRTGDVYRRTVEAIEYQAAHFAETPALIVACYDLGSWPGATQRRMLRTPGAFRAFGLRRTLALVRNTGKLTTRSEAASIYPAIENMLLAARSLGLAANLTTWHLAAEGEIKAILGIPKNVHTYALIPIGWPMGSFGPVRRRPVAQAIHHDRW
jgi:nitroreductase